MAEIIGFRGVRYEASRTEGALSELVAPPYDVISPDEQAELYAKNPHNVVRLILGREENKYQRAAQLFRQWLADGTLTADRTESVYVYRQSFRDPVTGEKCPERIGLVCLLKLEEYATGGVLPHENTLTAAKADRLELLRATEAQFESIYGLFSDPDNAVQSFLGEYDDREPVMEEVPDAIGSSHAIERIRDENAIATLQNLMRDKKIFIADGHHRYETALNYRREKRAQGAIPAGEAIAEDYIFITLTAFEDKGLLVLPTHRLVRGVDPAKVAALLQSLKDNFTLEPVAQTDALEAAILQKARVGQIAFGIVLPGGVSLATLKAGHARPSLLVPGPQSDALKKLPVTLLHTLILDQQLGIGPDALAAGGKVSYTRDASEALAGVKSGEYQAAFLLGRPLVDEVRDVSLAGDKCRRSPRSSFPNCCRGFYCATCTMRPAMATEAECFLRAPFIPAFPLNLQGLERVASYVQFSNSLQRAPKHIFSQKTPDHKPGEEWREERKWCFKWPNLCSAGDPLFLTESLQPREGGWRLGSGPALEDTRPARNIP